MPAIAIFAVGSIQVEECLIKRRADHPVAVNSSSPPFMRGNLYAEDAKCRLRCTLKQPDK